MSVFPNNVSWFRCRMNLDVLTKEFSLWIIIIFTCSCVTFFCFKSCKDWNWSLKILYKPIFLKFIANIFIYFCKFVPPFILNMLTSFLKQWNESMIFICKCNSGNVFPFCSFFIIVITSLCWHRIYSIFHFIPHVVFKLCIFTHWKAVFEIIFFPMLVCFLPDIKLNGIVTSSNCFNVIVDVSEFHKTAHIIVVN